MKKLPAIALAVLTAMVVPIAALAHHSHAMFDVTKTEDIEGTVKSFNFANPHVYLFLTKMGANGTDDTYPIEMSFIQNMMRQGMTNATFKVGDKVTVQVNPYRSGQPGGSYRGAVDVHGKHYGSLDPNAPRAGAD